MLICMRLAMSFVRDDARCARRLRRAGRACPGARRPASQAGIQRVRYSVWVRSPASKTTSAPLTTTRVDRCDERQPHRVLGAEPDALALRLRSRYGIAAKNPSAIVGRRTPAHALSMCSSSSCRFRKYHGALEGLGVTSGLARLSSGALMHRREDQERDREEDGGDELDEDEVGPDEDLFFALTLRPGPGRRRRLRGQLAYRQPSAVPYSGLAMPPSRRIRQKWTAMKIAAISGSAMTCRV